MTAKLCALVRMFVIVRYGRRAFPPAHSLA